MATDPTQPSSGPGPQGSPGEMDEAELQQRLEEQIRKVRVQDLILESIASILNLSARRIAKPDERDLEQGRIGIEAVRALVDLLEPEPREQVREALAQVQVLYAREAQGAEPAAEEGAGTAAGDAGPAGGAGAGSGGAGPGSGEAGTAPGGGGSRSSGAAGSAPGGTGGAQPKRPSKLWTPGRD